MLIQSLQDCLHGIEHQSGNKYIKNTTQQNILFLFTDVSKSVTMGVTRGVGVVAVILNIGTEVVKEEDKNEHDNFIHSDNFASS